MLDPKWLLVFAGALSTMSAAAQSPAPVTFPAEIAPHVPTNIERYFVAFLVHTATPKPMPHDLFVRHQAYMRSQVEKGTYHLIGPFTDNGRLRGTIILSAQSAEEARTIVEADPSVREGVLAVELHPALFPDLSSLKIQYPVRK